MKKLFTSVILLIAFFLSAGPVLASYISDSKGNLYAYDITTNGVTLIGNSGKGAWYDIALNPLTGKLYGITGLGDLYSISTIDGSAKHIGKTGKVINGLAFDSSGNLYGSGFFYLYKIDLSDGCATKVAKTGYNSSGDIAFDKNGNIYMTANKYWLEESDSLIYYDFASEQAEEIGKIGYKAVWGIGFADDTLYGFTFGNETIKIDINTGKGTLVAENGISAYGADTVAPVPLPSTVLLMGVGLGCIGLFGRKAKKKITG